MSETAQLGEAVALLCARAANRPEFFNAYLERVLDDRDATVATVEGLIELAWTLIDQLAPADLSREAIARAMLDPQPRRRSGSEHRT